MERVIKKQREVEDLRTDLAKQIRVARDKLRKASAGKRAAKNVVRIGLAASEATSIELSVSYVMMNATWNASYDVRLDTARMAVEVKFEGVVTQRTGEDWKDAKITLSTASPQIDQSMPELSKLAYQRMAARELARLAESNKAYSLEELEDSIAGDVPAMSAKLKRMKGGAEKRSQDFELKLANQVGAGFADKVPTLELQNPAPINRGLAPALANLRTILAGGTADFDVPGRETIPSDNSPHKITVAIKNFSGADVTYHYRTTPLLLEKAFLFGELVNSADYPLLPGGMNMFVDSSFIGRGIMPGAISGEKFTLSLGVDEGIRVKRRRLKKEIDAGKRISGTTRIEYAFEIKVENYKPFDCEIRVFDRYPICDNKEVNIGLDRPQPPIVDDEREDGILEWKLDVEKGTTRIIEFSYEIRHPNRFVIGGNE